MDRESQRTSETELPETPRENSQQTMTQLDKLTKPFKLEAKTYFALVFGLWFQIIRLLVAGLCLFTLKQLPRCETQQSELDRLWLIDFFTGLCIVFVFVNILFLLPVGLLGGEPALIQIVLKIFLGSCISLIFIIQRGFQLYDDLLPQQFEYDQNMGFSLMVARFMVLVGLCLFLGYITLSLIVLLWYFGIDGRKRKASVLRE